MFPADDNLIVRESVRALLALEVASRRLGVSAFARALLLAGAEPEELATTITAAVRNVPAIAFGDVIGANVAMCLVALPVGALVAPLPFGPRVRR